MGRKFWLWAGAITAGLALLAGAGAYALRDQLAYGDIAVGYAAKQTCSCLHVSGRAMESCLADFPEDARRQLTVTAEGQSVRASALFGTLRAEAVHEEGYGCRIVTR